MFNASDVAVAAVVLVGRLRPGGVKASAYGIKREGERG